MAISTILVVEDEALAGMELRETLEKIGYNVPPVIKRGEDVPDAIIMYNPDLILMDIRLKGFQDGIETAFIIGGEFEVPVVFLSAYSDETTLNRALGTKAYGYLVKPFDEKTLRTTIELALKRSKDYQKRNQNNWHKTVLENFPKPVFLTDTFGRIEFISKMTKSIIPEAEIGALVLSLFTDGNNINQIFSNLSKTDSISTEKLTLYLKPNDRVVSVEIAPVCNDDNRVTNYILILS